MTSSLRNSSTALPITQNVNKLLIITAAWIMAILPMCLMMLPHSSRLLLQQVNEKMRRPAVGIGG